MTIKCNTHINDIICHLKNMGWNSHFQTQLDQIYQEDLVPARIIGVRKNNFYVSNGENEWIVTLSGKITYNSNKMYPVTGDWVLIKDSVIYKVLTRQNVLTRGAAGKHNKQDKKLIKKQTIVANINTVFIVAGLDQDFNLRRIERYLTLVYNCGLRAVIILTKADLHQNTNYFLTKVKNIAFDVPIHLISLLDDTCLKSLETYLSLGCTTTMIGSSGAGKSTLINRLYGKKVQTTSPVSSHIGKGKHTTTSRDLIIMQNQRGMIIDNPGIREIAFWEGKNGIDDIFPDIEKLALQCRFADCSHIQEPGCRVLKAVAENKISKYRLVNYKKMKLELEYVFQRQNKSADRVEKDRWKRVALKIKSLKKKNSFNS